MSRPLSRSRRPASSYKEQFDSDVLSNWTNFVTIGDSKSNKSKAKVTIENGKLVFTMEDNYLYSYLIFDKQTYDDVSVEVSADNRGKNNNNISLICRYSDDGWYEFNIASNGLFNILAYDATGAVHKGYNTDVQQWLECHQDGQGDQCIYCDLFRQDFEFVHQW